MAIANTRRPSLAETVSTLSAEQKLEQVRTLLGNPAGSSTAMLRIKIWAIDEGVDLSDRAAFMPLAARAGLALNAAYKAWGREFRPDPPGLVALRVYGNDGRAYLVNPARTPVPELLSRQPAALYRWWDADGVLLYIGITDDLSERAGRHFRGSSWMEFAATYAVENHPDRAAAAAAEGPAIKAEQPLFNQEHNDTPEARRRLVEYLIGHDRLDLLAPAVSRG